MLLFYNRNILRTHTYAIGLDNFLKEFLAFSPCRHSPVVASWQVCHLQPYILESSTFAYQKLEKGRVSFRFVFFWLSSFLSRASSQVCAFSSPNEGFSSSSSEFPWADDLPQWRISADQLAHGFCDSISRFYQFALGPRENHLRGVRDCRSFRRPSSGVLSLTSGRAGIGPRVDGPASMEKKMICPCDSISGFFRHGPDPTRR